MKLFLPNLWVGALILVTANSVFSQTAQAEKRLGEAGGAYTFAVPAGFDSRQSDEGFGLFNATRTVVIAVKGHDFETFEKFAAQSNLESDGFSPVGKVQDFGDKGKTFRVSKQNPRGVLIVDTFVLFSPFGGGMLIAAFSDAAHQQEGSRAALQVANSVAFTKSRPAEVEQQLQTFFRGKHLLYLYSASGFSERTDIYLCPSGEFFFRSNSSSVSNNGSGVVGSNSDGVWKISTRGGASLVLQFRGGPLRQFKISPRQANNEIGLNGNRYFVQAFNECR